MHRHPVPPTGILLFFRLVQSQQNDYFNYDLFKVSKMTYDLLKVSKMTNYYDLLKVSCA